LATRAHSGRTYRIFDQRSQGATRLASGHAQQEDLFQSFIDDGFTALVAAEHLGVELARTGARYGQLHDSHPSAQAAAIEAVGLISSLLGALVGMSLEKALPLIAHQLLQKLVMSLFQQLVQILKEEPVF
jgi:hypothetical protein